jgi:hypothetical protein
MRVDFSRGNVLGPAVWAGDFHSREHVAPFPARVDAAQFNDANAVAITQSGGAAANATAVPVVATTVAIPAGRALYWGGSKKFSRVTVDAAIGATSLTVEALPTALVDGDIAYFSPYPDRKTLKSGTLLGRTYTERDAGTAFGAAVYTDDEFFILLYDIEDANYNPDATLYRNGSLVFEDKLPDWTAISGNANLLATLRSKYQCIKRG